MEMNNKIKELTQKIRLEGYEKAQIEAESIKNAAINEAEEIKNKARAEADNIITQARKEAASFADRVMSDLKLSVEQSLLNLKKEIGELLVTEVIEEPMVKSMNDSKFVTKLIEQAVMNWKEYDENVSLEIMLPNESYSSVHKQFINNAHNRLNNGIVLKSVSGISGGFEIKPHNSHYKICMTDEAFEAFLKDNLRPITKQFLFGDGQ